MNKQPSWPSLLHLNRPLSGGLYFATGVSLLLLKYAIDWTLARFMLGRNWSPWSYFAPGAAVGMPDWGQNAAFFLAMLAVSLPFIATGLLLTLRRLRTTGLPQITLILFFLPVINFIYFLILALHPDQADDEEIPFAQIHREPGPTGRLQYGLDDEKPAWKWIGRFLPRSPRGSAWAGALVPVPVGLALVFLGVNILHSYGWGVFVALPFFLGLLGALVRGFHHPLSFGQALVTGIFAVIAFAVGLIGFALEGAICVVMALPLAIPLGMIGGTVGCVIQSSWHPRMMMVLLAGLPLFMGAERIGAPAAPLFCVVTSVDVDAPPSVVWRHVISFRQLPPPTELIFKTGVAYPIRAQINGQGVGAIRECIFSTGSFVERITAWDEHKLLAFDVSRNPPPLREWTPWSTIHPPHLENFLVSKGGQFKLIDLGNGRTRLEGTTWYQHHMWPASYWGMWSDPIIGSIHERVLKHVKSLAENEPAPIAIQ